MFWIVVAVASVVISALLTWGVRELAIRRGLVTVSFASHHGHKNPTPRVGGIAIFSTFALIYGAYLFGGWFGLTRRPTNADLLKLLAPATMLFLVGLVDDLRGLRARTKLLFQIAGGICLYVNGIRFCYQWHDLGGWGSTAFCLVATVFWVVLVCNAINLIDGLDGLAAGSVLFSLITILTVAVASGRYGVATAALVLGGALGGFLVFNFNPASIFLGDSGSLFLGFMLGGFALAESPLHRSVSNAIVIPLISLALPITDTLLSILRRFLSGHSLFGADREHIHHKLLAMGLTDRQAVWILYGCSATASILSLSLLNRVRLIIPVVGLLTLIVFFGLRKLNYREFTEFARIWKRLRMQKRAFARNIALRKAIAEIENIHHFSNLVRALEQCLSPDFCGVEINVDCAPGGWQRQSIPPATTHIWSTRFRRQSVLKLELKTNEEEHIGSLSLFGCAEKSWLVDLELLSGPLCHSVAMALENCARAPKSVVLHVPHPAFADNVYADSPSISNGTLL